MCANARSGSGRGVLERRFVPTAAGESELVVIVVDVDAVGDDLAAGAVVAGDDARDRALRVVRRGDPHGHAGAGPEPSLAGRVVDLDPAGDDREQVARLERPGELAERRAAEPAREDVLEHGPLRLVGAVVEVEHPRPRRPGSSSLYHVASTTRRPDTS